MPFIYDFYLLLPYILGYYFLGILPQDTAILYFLLGIFSYTIFLSQFSRYYLRAIRIEKKNIDQNLKSIKECLKIYKKNLGSMSQMAREFSEAALEEELPNQPVVLKTEDVEFLTKMVISELYELNKTVFAKEEDCIDSLKTAIEKMDKGGDEFSIDDRLTIANQADAGTDMIYYILQKFSCHGINLDPVFAEVHHSNMSKRDPTTQKFIRREDGKILKPENFVPPDILSIISQQIEFGAWV